jgi:hypothetical protein
MAMGVKRDQIAQAMWEDYQRILVERNFDILDDEVFDDDIYY